MATESTKDMMQPRSMNEPSQPATMPEGHMGSASEKGMPEGRMEQSADKPVSGMSNMPAGDMRSDGGLKRVLVEMRVPDAQVTPNTLQMAAAGFSNTGFQLDTSYAPVPVAPSQTGMAPQAAGGGQTMIVRGEIHPDKLQELENRPDVVKVWADTAIAPFSGFLVEERSLRLLSEEEALATCPIGTCDCTPGTAKGTIADVANYLGADRIWSAGYKGEGIVVGIVDGGITAIGRTPKAGETARVAHVIGGWPTKDWGTTSKAWDDHGNMTSTDVLGMAPEAHIYDIRISGAGGAVSEALAGYQWAIDQHRRDGTPQILSNSWGIYQESWDSEYARDPDHPFTRKVVEAIDEGIVVLFAAGNCGATCPSSRCGTDTGPGRSIWGANGHPQVITVGAVNKDEQFVGYSSQGPAALDPEKPDFCAITHFKGYFASDNGTSAATPVAAGVAALLRQCNPSLTQSQIKDVLKSTAKDIGPAGTDQHSGAGIIQAGEAFAKLQQRQQEGVAGWSNWEDLSGVITAGVAAASWGANRLDCFVKGTDNGLWHKWWDGVRWNGWEGLGGILDDTPAAVSWGPNRIDCFARGMDNHMWHKWWDGSGWRGWEDLGGIITSGPAVCSWGSNRLDCFAKGTDNGLWHKWWDGTRWNGWEGLGGTLDNEPAAVSWGPNRIDCFARGMDNHMWHKWWDGSAWRGWEDLGGIITSGPAVCSWGSNRLDCFAKGTDNGLWHKWWDGTRWNGWEGLGGVMDSTPGAVSWGQGRIDCFARGMDNHMWHKWFD
jgi:serine protease AprX